MTFAVVRIRSSIKSAEGVAETLKFLNLTRINHCVVIPETDSYKGMLAKVKDYVTWGEISAETIQLLLQHRGALKDKGPLDDQSVASTGFSSLKELSEAVASGKFALNNFKALTPVFRLPPPVRGYEGIKNHYNRARPTHGGSLGYRGGDINTLLEKMVSNKPMTASEKAAKKEKNKAKSSEGQKAVKKEASKEEAKKKAAPKKKAAKKEA